MVVTIYSTPTCPYCKMAKKYFDENKVEYKDINVAEDHDAAVKMVEISGQQGVPVIVIGDTILVGFDQEAVEKALKESDKKAA